LADLEQSAVFAPDCGKHVAGVATGKAVDNDVAAIAVLD
jgi:hypothetical protein